MPNRRFDWHEHIEDVEGEYQVRSYWAHEADAMPDPMTIAGARARLQTYLSWLPDEWG